MTKWLGMLCACLCAWTICACAPAGATAREGAVAAEDFAYRGLALGATEADAIERLGEPNFTKDVSVFGIRVKYLVYGNRVQIGIANRTGKVVDLAVTDEDYTARNGIKRGATRYAIVQTYGAVNRTLIEGRVYYIYAHPEHARERLFIEGDAEQGYLRSMRITALPVSVEEADAWAEEDETFAQGSLFDAQVWHKTFGYAVLGREPKQPQLTWGGYKGRVS